MADTSIGITVTAETAAAVQQLRKLEDAVKDGMTAADAAGKSQKGLAAEVARAKSAQADATDAVRRAREAMQEHRLTQEAYGKGSKEAAASQRRLEAAQRDAAEAAKRAAAQLGAAAKATEEVVRAEGKASPAAKRLQGQLDKVGDEAERAAGELRKLDLQLRATADPSRLQAMGKALDSFKGNLAAMAVSNITGGLKNGLVHVVKTGAEFERLRVALETTTGSAETAASEFERLQKFAAATPYGVQEVTEAFIKLGNRGIAPTDRVLTSFGNTASAMGKSLDDMVEAVADAVTGENERLKEFGIVGKKEGDKIAYTFKGVTTEVQFSADAITEYLTRIGETNFAGGMDKQSKTLLGMWSTLEDNAAALSDEFTQGLAPALKKIMEGFGGVDEEGRAAATALGETVGEGLSDVVDVAASFIETLSGENGAIAQTALFSAGLFALGGPLGVVAYAAFEAGQALAEMFDDVPPEMRKWMAENGKRDAEQRKSELAAQQAEIDALSAEMDRVYNNGQKLDELSRRWSLAQEKRGKKSKGEIEKNAFGFREAARGNNRMLGGGTTEDRIAAWEKDTARLEKENEFNDLSKDKNLSPSEKKRFNELSKELDIAKPKKGKKPKKPPKDPTKAQRDEMDFDAQIDTYAAKLNKEQKAEYAKEAEEKHKLETAQREARIADIDREIEALEEKGEAEVRQAEFLWFTIDSESQAEEQRRQLQETRIAREMELAQWQLESAKNDEQRLAAQTKIEEAQHKKRLLLIQKTNAAEALEQRKKIQTFEMLNGAIQDVGASSIDAIEAQVQGEKGAIAEMVSNYAKGIRNKMILKAAEETAYGVAALAGIVTAGLAGPHFAAAGLAAGAAALAGGAQAGFAAIAADQRAAALPAANSAPALPAANSMPSTSGTAAGALPPGAPAGERREGLAAQDVPISYEQQRRETPRSEQSPLMLVVNVHGNVIGAGGERELARYLQGVLDQHGRRSGRALTG